jgi:hypothetical protein
VQLLEKMTRVCLQTAAFLERELGTWAKLAWIL